MPNNVFPYPGNKARHSEWILQHFPEHECYVELFGGAAGVLFNKPRSKIEVYNDLNGDIPHFFKVLRDRCEELQEWLRNVPFSRELHNKWGEQFFNTKQRPSDDIERAGRFYTLRYTSFGGEYASKSGFKANKRAKAGSPSKQFYTSTESLHEFRDRLRGVSIDNMSAFDVIDQRDRHGTLFYADPPYEGTESRYNAEGFDHRQLAEKAKEIDGKIAISYDSIPHFYDEDFTAVSKCGTFSGGNENGRKDCTEYLIMNYDSNGEPIMSEVGQQTLV